MPINDQQAARFGLAQAATQMKQAASLPVSDCCPRHWRRLLIHWSMLRRPTPQQTAFEMVSLEGLVPKNHLLRKIEAVIDFSFIYDRVAGLYCPDNGRPPLDPTLMFKALFIGYLFGIRSERQLVREIEVNVAYRWF
jgi:Transposase domain (DUF772)